MANFWDVEESEQNSDYSVLPEGKYVLQCINSTIKDTKSGTGKYINMQFEVLTPPHKGRRIFKMYNVINDSAQALSIAKAELKQLCIATESLPWFEKLNSVRSWDEAESHIDTLHETICRSPFEAHIIIKKSSLDGDENKIKAVAPIGGVKQDKASGSPKIGKNKSPFD